MTPDKNTPRILLVDDDRDMCTSLADVIELDAGYRVNFTTDPFKALELIDDKEYALVIIDFKMPEMNGLELLEKIKSKKPGQTVFILTAFISNDLIEKARSTGAEKVLSKFIWPDEILKNINQVL